MFSATDSLASIGRRRTRPAEVLAAGVLAFGGLVLLAIAVAGLSLQFVSDLPRDQVAKAALLYSAGPVFLAIGVVHFIAAGLMISGRMARLVAAGFAASGAGVSLIGAVLVALGRDPLAAWSRPNGGSAADGITILAAFALVYASIAVVAVRSTRS